jgi:hypothetical protein
MIKFEPEWQAGTCSNGRRRTSIECADFSPIVSIHSCLLVKWFSAFSDHSLPGKRIRKAAQGQGREHAPAVGGRKSFADRNGTSGTKARHPGARVAMIHKGPGAGTMLVGNFVTRPFA